MIQLVGWAGTKLSNISNSCKSANTMILSSSLPSTTKNVSPVSTHSASTKPAHSLSQSPKFARPCSRATPAINILMFDSLWSRRKVKMINLLMGTKLWDREMDILNWRIFNQEGIKLVLKLIGIKTLSGRKNSVLLAMVHMQLSLSTWKNLHTMLSCTRCTTVS